MGSSKRYLNVKGMTGTQSTSQVQQTLLLMAEGETLQAEAGRCKALNELITILGGEAALRGGPGAPKED